MKLRHNPFPLVFNQGDVATRLASLEFLGLKDTERSRDLLRDLAGQQGSNGTFPSNLNSQEWGMLETVRYTVLLLMAGLPSDHKGVRSAVEFILSRQNRDGGWCENDSLEIPRERVELSNKESVTWLTADIVELLCRVGTRDSLPCRRALRWLKKMQNAEGGWYCFSGCVGDRLRAKGDPDSTAQITFLLGDVYGKDDPAFLRGKALFETFLDACAEDADRRWWTRLQDGKKEEVDVYHLTHLLLSSLVDPPRRFQSGYGVGDPRVKRMMEVLVAIQRPDGGWRPFWAEGSSAVYTALAVKVLLLSGAISRESLNECE